MDYDELARRLQAREERAFLDFAEAFARPARALFLSLGLPPFEAEDLVSVCMSDIPLKKVHRYRARTDGSFRAWTFTVLRNAAMDWKRRNRGKRVPLVDDVAQAETVEVMPRVERVAAVQEALLELNPGDRQIVELRHLGENRTFEEIGEILNISAATARVRHHRALNRLEELLRSDSRIHLKDTAATESSGQG